MQYKAIYLIRPRSALAKLPVDDPDLRDILVEPCLWTNEEGGRSAKPADCTAAVKTLFVAHVRQLFRAAGLHASPVALMTVDAAEFDRWWEIQRFDGWDEEAADVLARLHSSRALGDVATEVQSAWKLLIRCS